MAAKRGFAIWTAISRCSRPGAYVRCAVTGREIPLDELKYWSVELQEAYADAATSLKRHQETAHT